MRCAICVRLTCICIPGDHTNAMRRADARIDDARIAADALSRLTARAPGGQSILTRAQQLANACAERGGLGVLKAGEDQGPGRVMVPVPVLQDLIAVAEAAGEREP